MSVLSLHKIATIPSDGLLFAVGFDTNMLIWFSYRVRSWKQLQIICNVWRLTSSRRPTIDFNSTSWGLITCTQKADNKNSVSACCVCVIGGVFLKSYRVTDHIYEARQEPTGSDVQNGHERKKKIQMQSVQIKTLNLCSFIFLEGLLMFGEWITGAGLEWSWIPAQTIIFALCFLYWKPLWNPPDHIKV